VSQGHGALAGRNREPAALSASELYERGLKAEAKGDTGFAASFFRVARGKGLQPAVESLVRLESLPSAPRNVRELLGR
jgi:hypothetical protein